METTQFEEMSQEFKEKADFIVISLFKSHPLR